MPKAPAKAKPVESPSSPGTMLIRAHVAFYQGLPAGHIGEVPTEIAEAAIANGYATAVGSLSERMKGEPPEPKLASDVNPPGTTAP